MSVRRWEPGKTNGEAEYKNCNAVSKCGENSRVKSPIVGLSVDAVRNGLDCNRSVRVGEDVDGGGLLRDEYLRARFTIST
jgi:hypothetical protein